MNGKLESLVQSLQAHEEAAQREAREAKEREGGRKVAIAQAFDAHNAGLPAIDAPRPFPWFVHAVSYKHNPSAGWMSFKGLSFEEVAQMLRDYPPVPKVRYRSSSRRESGIRHAGFVPDYADTQSETDGCELHISKGIEYGPTVQVRWSCQMGAMIVDIHAELRPSQFTPRLHAKRNEWQGQVVSIDGSTARVVYPFGDTAGLQNVRYAQGSRTAYPSFLIWGNAQPASGMLRYIDSVAAECLRRETESFAAYLADKRAGCIMAKPADRMKGMSAGSPAQNAALDSPDALRDRALAEKHWVSYVKDSRAEDWPKDDKPDIHSRGYFDYYAWACKWLLSVGLYADPSFLRKNGQPYKYGTAWVNADGSIHGE